MAAGLQGLQTAERLWADETGGQIGGQRYAGKVLCRSHRLGVWLEWQELHQNDDPCREDAR